MPLPEFSVTFDYRCPFARTAHEHLAVALESGADWNVSFVPFSLAQAHVAEGDVDVWDEPQKDTGLVALMAGVVVRDQYPDLFLRTHVALFAARHDRGLQIREPDVVRGVLTDTGVDADAVFAEIAGGGPLATVRKEHEAAVADNKVWGVPTFVAGDQASFVRLMRRPEGNVELARGTVERILDLLVGWPDLNEFKHTSIPR